MKRLTVSYFGRVQVCYFFLLYTQNVECCIFQCTVCQFDTILLITSLESKAFSSTHNLLMTNSGTLHNHRASRVHWCWLGTSCCRKMLFSKHRPLLQVFLHMVMNCRGALPSGARVYSRIHVVQHVREKQCPHTELHRDMSYVTVGIQSSLWGRCPIEKRRTLPTNPPTC